MLAAPKANVIDAAMTAALTDAFRRAAATPSLKAVLLEGEGDHFSFGAQRGGAPARAGGGDAGRLPRPLPRPSPTPPCPSLAVVRGQCLGGGLELAAFAHRVVAAPSAKLGQPEIRLGVFAPVASVLLPERIGRAAAEDLCLTGADRGRRRGAWRSASSTRWPRTPARPPARGSRESLLPHSAASLRRAVRAVRWGLDRRLREDLDAIERLYLDDLMTTADAKEGIRAFLEKRRPRLERRMTDRARERSSQYAEAISRDYGLASVKAWKERTKGLAVGYMPVYVPRELLYAQDVLPVGILGGGDDLEIIRGDAYYQSYICHIPRSTIELGLNGSLDVLDGMLFPATCDVIRNLSGMWKMLFPDKLVRYLDVPQDFDAAIGGSFYRQELESLSEELGRPRRRALRRRGAARGDPASTTRTAGRGRELYDLRRREPWKVPTHELYLLLRAGDRARARGAHRACCRTYLERRRRRRDPASHGPGARRDRRAPSASSLRWA